MKRILKYPFDRAMIEAPFGKVLLIAQQHDSSMPTMWLEADESNLSAVYYIIGTGDVAPENLDHVGSAVCGEYVWHVYR